MVDTSKIKEHSEVVGSDGQHVGTVDHLDGGRLKLTKKDPAAHGEHHYIDLGLIASVGDKVTLNVSAAEAQKKATTA
jgi:hypothetical protein